MTAGVVHQESVAPVGLQVAFSQSLFFLDFPVRPCPALDVHLHDSKTLRLRPTITVSNNLLFVSATAACSINWNAYMEIIFEVVKPM